MRVPRRAALRAARVAAKYTQTALARRAGVERSYLSHLEAGDFDPSAAVALRIAEVLGVEPRDLFPDLAELPPEPAPAPASGE